MVPSATAGAGGVQEPDEQAVRRSNSSMVATIPGRDDRDIGSRPQVAGDAEGQPPVVGQDGDGDLDAMGDRDERSMLEHLASEAEEGELRARDVASPRCRSCAEDGRG